MHGTGKISTEHTVWCSRCEEWRQLCEYSITGMKQAIIHDGWKLIRGLWMCPDCSAKQEAKP